MRLGEEHFADRAYPLTVADALDLTVVAGDTFTLLYDSEATAPPTEHFDLIVDTEIIHITSRAGTTCTIGARGAHGTAVAAHGALSPALHGPLAHHLAGLYAQVNGLPPAGRAGLFVPEDWGRFWFRDLASPALATSRWHGTSITRGLGSSLYGETSYWALVDHAIKARYGDGGPGFCGVESSDVYAAFGGFAGHGQWVTTGAWTTSGVVGFGGTTMSTVVIGATMTFPNLYGRYIRVAYETGVGKGTFDVIVDGVVMATINSNAVADAKVSAAIDLLIAQPITSVVIKNNAAGGTTLAGIFVYADTGYSGSNLGKAGATSRVINQLAYTGAPANRTYLSDTIGLQIPKSPSLVVLEYGVNDRTQAVPEDEFVANLALAVATVDVFHQSGEYDLVVIVFPSLYADNTNTAYKYWRGARAAAEMFGAALYFPHLAETTGLGIKAMLGAGLYPAAGIDVHPTDAGHDHFASPLVALLTGDSFEQTQIADG